MLFDRYPHSVESIVKPTGAIVIPGSKTPNLVVAMMLGTAGIQIPIICATLDVGWWGLLGLLAFPLAALCFLVKQETRIDPAAGTVTNLWVVGKSQCLMGSTELSKYDAVTFGWYTVSNKNGSYRVDCVGLLDQTTGESRELTRVKDETDSRAYGEAIAKALNLPLQRLGTNESRSVDELDTKLADRFDVEELPAAPERMRSQLRNEGDQFVIDINGPDPDDPGMKALGQIGKVCGVIGVGFLLYVAIDAKLDLLSTLVLLAGSYLVARWIYWFVITTTLNEMQQQAARVTLASDKLIIWERSLRAEEATTDIPYDELEEFYHDTKGRSEETPEWLNVLANSHTKLVASSDQTTKEFAAWLTRAEKDYLVVLVRQLVVRMNQRELQPNAQPQPNAKLQPAAV